MGSKQIRHVISFGGMLAAIGSLTACAITPNPVTPEETSARIEEFRGMLTLQPLPQIPITLHEAIARAVRYNLSTRIKEVERQIAENRLDASIWTLLPKVIGSGGRTGRDNVLASSSKSTLTGQQSLEVSTSQDRTVDNADLKMSWNILDFGVSYFTTRQLANQSLVAEERRKKVVQQLINDVRDAYWRAVGAERLMDRIEDALGKVVTAIAKAEAIEETRAQKPVEILNYQRDLYSKLLQLQGLRRTFVASKLDLAKMMNLPPSTSFKVVIPIEAPALPPLAVEVAVLEEQSLIQRSELIEESLQERIAADEIRKSIARMFPGLELTGSRSYTSNTYTLHNRWNEASVKLSWNLINLLSGWDDIEQAEMQKHLVSVRRQTLGMAVISQVNLAYMDYREAEDAYKTTARIQAVNEKIEAHKNIEATTQNLGDLELIQNQLNTLLSQLKKDEQYAQLQNSVGRLALSVGEDPFAGVDDSLDLPSLVQLVAEREKAWLNGKWFNKPPS